MTKGTVRVLIAAVALTLIASATFVGCKGKEAPAGGEADLVFALVPKALDNPVFNVARRGAMDKAAELGGIRVEWVGPEVADAAKQAMVIESLIARGVDGMAISCNDPDVLIGPINKAVEAGIPTITFDSDSPDSKRVTFYGTDNYPCGTACGELIVEATGGVGEIAVLTGVLGASNLETRIDGVRDVIAKHPDMKIISVQPCDDDIQKGVAVIQSFMQAHPNLGGWVMVGGWPLFAQAPTGLPGVDPAKCKVISVDALESQLEYLEQGLVYALVGQNLYEWGAGSVEILKGIIDGEEYPPSMDSGVYVVREEDVDERMAEWEKFKD